jgi:hypothetical protein
MRYRTTLSVLLSIGLTSIAAAQVDYFWDGSQNNNWDNGPNWSGASGWPDAPNHNAHFDFGDFGAEDN